MDYNPHFLGGLVICRSSVITKTTVWVTLANRLAWWTYERYEYKKQLDTIHPPQIRQTS